MMNDADVERVAQGYDAVYGAIPRSPTFRRLWREYSLGDDYPVGFEHISFLTLREMQWMQSALQLSPNDLLVDLACGMGGPGLWIARSPPPNSSASTSRPSRSKRPRASG